MSLCGDTGEQGGGCRTCPPCREKGLRHRSSLTGCIGGCTEQLVLRPPRPPSKESGISLWLCSGFPSPFDCCILAAASPNVPPSANKLSQLKGAALKYHTGLPRQKEACSALALSPG